MSDRHYETDELLVRGNTSCIAGENNRFEQDGINYHI